MRDACSWKGQLEKNEKLESFKLESTNRSRKVFNAVLSHQKFSNFCSNLPTSFFLISSQTFELEIFQLLEFSNCRFQVHVSIQNLSATGLKTNVFFFRKWEFLTKISEPGKWKNSAEWVFFRLSMNCHFTMHTPNNVFFSGIHMDSNLRE